MTKTLACLEGTDYYATVTRDTNNMIYEVRVFRPPTGAEEDAFKVAPGMQVDDQLVGAGTLNPTDNVAALNRVVERIVESDTPALLGKWTGGDNE